MTSFKEKSQKIHLVFFYCEFFNFNAFEKLIKFLFRKSKTGLHLQLLRSNFMQNSLKLLKQTVI